MGLAWVELLFFFAAATTGTFGQYNDFDAYNLYEDGYSVPNPYQLLQRPSRFRSSLQVPMYKPQDLFPSNFPSQNIRVKMPRVPMPNMAGVMPGRYRLGEAIVDEMKDDPSTFVVKKSSGRNPPPLPMGFEKLLRSSRAMHYNDNPDRRTLGLLSSGHLDISGQSHLDDLDFQRQRDVDDLKFQASLSNLRNRHDAEDLRTEMNNRYEMEKQQFASDNEIDFQLALERERNNHKLDLLEQSLQKIEDDYYNTYSNKITTTYNPKLTTKTRFTFGFPIPFIG